MFGMPTWIMGLIGGLVVLLGVGASEYFLYSKWQLAESNRKIEHGNVEKLTAAYNGAVKVNTNLNAQITQLVKDKEYDENLLLVQHDAIITLQRKTNDRKTQVAKLPSGAASPALICAITGVCDEASSTSSGGGH